MVRSFFIHLLGGVTKDEALDIPDKFYKQLITNLEAILKTQEALLKTQESIVKVADKSDIYDLLGKILSFLKNEKYN